MKTDYFPAHILYYTCTAIIVNILNEYLLYLNLINDPFFSFYLFLFEPVSNATLMRPTKVKTAVHGNYKHLGLLIFMVDSIDILAWSNAQY